MKQTAETAKDDKGTQIINGMTIYTDTALKAYLEQAGFCKIQSHKTKRMAVRYSTNEVRSCRKSNGISKKSNEPDVPGQRDCQTIEHRLNRWKMSPVCGSGWQISSFTAKGDTTIMIDAGYNYDRLAEKMNWLGIDPHSIRHILITHQDTDHVGAVVETCRLSESEREPDMKYKSREKHCAGKLILPLYSRKLCSELYPNLYRDETAVRLIDQIDYDFSVAEKFSQPDAAFRCAGGGHAAAGRPWEVPRDYLKPHPCAAVFNLGCGQDNTNGKPAATADAKSTIWTSRMLLPCGSCCPPGAGAKHPLRPEGPRMV